MGIVVPRKKGVNMRLELYVDSDGKKIDPNLFSKTAEKLAKELRRNSSKNKLTQVRKFYDEVVFLRDRAGRTPKQENWEHILPLVRMLAAKAAYAHGRGHVDDTFFDFISESVQQIFDRKDLEVFTFFFEALIGYLKFHELSDNQERGRRH